jgi:hypothetical protein
MRFGASINDSDIGHVERLPAAGMRACDHTLFAENPTRVVCTNTDRDAGDDARTRPPERTLG